MEPQNGPFLETQMKPRKLPQTTPKGDQNESKKGPQNDDFRGAFLEAFSTPFGGSVLGSFLDPSKSRVS